MIKGNKIKPFLWFEHQAEDAAKFYTSTFKNSKIGKVARYPEGSPGTAGSVMTVAFQIEGQDFLALNGGPHFKFTEAVSFMIECETQDEIDYYWERLLEGGKADQCGWLKDRFGLSWQVVPANIDRIFSGKDSAKAQRAMQAMLKMIKLNIEELENA
ncbi:MAG TPA: VOC family protein [Burkholderiales bacterium]|nr:VOC family protein [Burkholderiales bacterium]